MTGPKLNEKNHEAGSRSGTKASARYMRVSAYKAREVLNLIRGLPVRNADETLQFTDRHVSDDIRKVLASAVANAVNNDEQDISELYVKACFADEGPTLKRFAARARGRGTRILKRTCHITIVVDRLDDDRLEVVQGRDARRTAAGRRRGAAAGGTAGRKARVERSRQRAAGLKDGDEGAALDADTGAEESIDLDTTATADTPADTADTATSGDVGTAEVQGFADLGDIAPAGEKELPAGAVASNDDGSAPEGYTVKGNADSGYYHAEGSRYYDRTVAEFWFKSIEDAEAAGFTLPPSLQDKTEADDEETK